MQRVVIINVLKTEYGARNVSLLYSLDQFKAGEFALFMDPRLSAVDLVGKFFFET